MRKKDVIPGSKVPITYLIDYIKEGYGISDFLASYPWIKRKSVENALDEIKKRDFTSQYAL
jgi:uncharacterized protein (DUF433 family)